MKNYDNSIRLSLITLSILLFSCEDILEEDPRGLLTSDNFWTNEQNVIGAINNVYTRPIELPNGVFSWNFWFESSAHDFGTGSGHPSGMISGTWDASTNQIFDAWRCSYEPISLANFVLSNVNDATNVSDNLKTRVEGEASFLRAMHYFNLVRLFGDVPLLLKQTEGDDEFLTSRAPASDVYEAIIADLNRAIAQLPTKSEFGQDGIGRATKGAAMALLAKVHLTRGNFQETVDLTAAVIASGEYALQPNFKDIFLAENDTGQEWLFSYAVNGEATPTSTHQTAQFGFPNNLGRFGFRRAFGNIWVKEPLLQIYDQENDTRFTDMIWTEYVDPTTGETVPFIKGSTFYSKKYYDIEFSKDMVLTRVNYPVLRYSDVLLMYAEALNEVSPLDSDAFAKLNMVRNRANIGDLTAAELTSKEAFTNEVLDERRREFVNENQRLFDLKRRERLIKFSQQFDYAQFSAEDVLYPIPQREIDANPNLTQNEGY